MLTISSSVRCLKRNHKTNAHKFRSEGEKKKNRVRASMMIKECEQQKVKFGGIEPEPKPMRQSNVQVI